MSDTSISSSLSLAEPRTALLLRPEMNFLRPKERARLRFWGKYGRELGVFFDLSTSGTIFGPTQANFGAILADSPNSTFRGFEA